MRTSTIYQKVVNIAEDGEITVLDEIFEYSDSFKGATGNSFYPVSKAEYNEAMKLDNIASYLSDCISFEDVPGHCKYLADEVTESKNPYKKWAKEIKDDGDAESLMFDTSYSELWDYLRETAKLSKKDAYIFSCSGGGRCFDKNFNGNVNGELSPLIRQAES